MDRDEQLDVSLRAEAPACPQLIVTFSDYEPPFDVASTTQRILDSVPQQYLTELFAVVLTNASGLPRKRRNSTVKARQRKVRLSAARGQYHPAAKGNRAWIEIFVDNTLRGWEKGWWLRVPFIRESKFSDVLFHEIAITYISPFALSTSIRRMSPMFGRCVSNAITTNNALAG